MTIRTTGKIMLAMLAMLAMLSIMPSSFAATSALGESPPDRVARLGYLSGAVSLQPAGDTEWTLAELNWPLTTGDKLWVGQSGRTELQIGSTALRLDRETAVAVINLDDTTIQIKLAQGRLAARVRNLPLGEDIEFDTPNLAFQATAPGSFRLDVAADGSATTVTVHAGAAMLYGDTGSVAIRAGQQMRFSGTHLQQQLAVSASPPDAFDLWAAGRDQATDNSTSARYVSGDIAGYQDLDANGVWQDSPDYGEVWVPSLALSAGWAPYREGRWAWIAPWGWSWVDAEAWGFAPFHYGRWAKIRGVWAWVPGLRRQPWYPVYAPALVAFIGGANGSGWGVSLPFTRAGGPCVAWLPLGPGEIWRPAYGYSTNYFNRANNLGGVGTGNASTRNTVRNRPSHYLNRDVPGAITAVTAKTFVRGESVAPAAIAVMAEQMTHAVIGAAAPAIAPVRASFNGGMRATTRREPPALGRRHIVMTQMPTIPAAYHDVLAQRYAENGGRVPGGGEAVVRLSDRAAEIPPQDFSAAQTAPAYPIAPQPQRRQQAARPTYPTVTVVNVPLSFRGPTVPTRQRHRAAMPANEPIPQQPYANPAREQHRANEPYRLPERIAVPPPRPELQPELQPARPAQPRRQPVPARSYPAYRD